MNEEFPDFMFEQGGGGEGGDEQEHYEAFVKQQQLEIAQLGMMEFEINQNIMKQALDICQQSWFWKFRDIKVRLKILRRVYYELHSIFHPQQKE